MPFSIAKFLKKWYAPQWQVIAMHLLNNLWNKKKGKIMFVKFYIKEVYFILCTRKHLV